MDFDEQAWRDAVEGNFISAVRWCRAVVPHMTRQKWGRIINIVSISVKQPIPTLALSNAARSGLIGYAKTLAGELAPHGVRVNNVLPGTHLTDRTQRLAEAGESQEQLAARLAQKIPIGRVGTPDDFGPLVAFLASERADYICGASIPIDGGSYAGMM